MARTQAPKKGTLYTRGKRNTYYLEFFVGGKRFQRRLTTSDGKAITTLREAEKARGHVLAPYLAEDERSLRAQAVAALETATEAAAAAQEAAAPPELLQLADVWAQFPYTESTPTKSTRTRRKLAARTVTDNAALWDKFVRWMADAHPDRGHAEDVTPEIAGEFSRHIRETEGLSHNRHNKLIQTASVMFRATGRPDPFADIPRYSFVPESRENLEREDLLKVANEATGELRRLYLIAMFSGMRLGDCATLQWADVRLAHNRMIRRTAKSGAVVSFPLHPALREELEQTPADRRQGPVSPEMAALYARNPSAISKQTRALFEAVGITTREDREGGKRRISRRNFHSFRHSFVTECARAGVPVGQIRDWIGHQSTLITRVYEHWTGDESQERILAALPDTRELGPIDAEEARDRTRLAEAIKTLPIARVRELLDQL